MRNLLFLCLILGLTLGLLTGCNTSARTAGEDTPAQNPPTLSLANAQTLPAALRIPLSRQHGYLFVNGQVNGKRAGLMLFDTGSTLTIVDRGVANRMNLPEDGEGRTVGVAGTASFGFRRVDSMAIAGLDLGIERVASLSMYKLTRGFRMNPGGLIGFTALSDYPFTIDYQRSEIVLYRPDAFTPPPNAPRFRLHSFRGLPAVIATLGGGQEVLLIIDTGADNALTLPDQCAQMPGVLGVSTTGRGVSHGVGGNVHTVQGYLKHLDIFGLRLNGLPVTFEPPPTGLTSNQYPVGRIGGDLIESFRLTYDMRHRAIWAQFVPDSSDQ